MRILVVEDEKRLADYLHKGLAEAGHVVDVAHDGIDGRHMALTGSYDVVVLDVMLPGIDGFEVLAAIRQGSQAAVLMLTALDAVDDRVRGLHTGADDYMVKPYAFSELLARLDALQRRGVRSSTRDATTLQAADLVMDLMRRRVMRGGTRIELTAKEFKLLGLLLRRQGEVLSRTVLAEQVWDINFDSGTNTVDVAIRRLRAKIDDAFEPKLLHTVRGMGYMLEAP
jgi:heavy metal response regulator